MNSAVNSINSPLIPGYRTGTWKVDPQRSKIEFAVRAIIGNAHGTFTEYGAVIVTGEDLLDSSVTATINLASIDTGNRKRDAHLRGPSLLDVKTRPAMTYRSTGIQRADLGVTVNGLLTLNGTARPVPLALAVKGFSTDPTGRQHASFSATAQISRRDFGLAIPMSRGGVVIGDRVSINLELDAVLSG